MEIHIGNRVADVTLVSKEGNKVRLSIDGKPYDVDIVMTENGSCSVLHDGNSFNAEIISGEDHRSYDVNMFYRSYHVDIVDTQKKYLRMRKSAEEKQDDKIVAPMPGKVVKIPVRKGDRLETNCWMWRCHWKRPRSTRWRKRLCSMRLKRDERRRMCRISPRCPATV